METNTTLNISFSDEELKQLIGLKTIKGNGRSGCWHGVNGIRVDPTMYMIAKKIEEALFQKIKE